MDVDFFMAFLVYGFYGLLWALLSELLFVQQMQRMKRDVELFADVEWLYAVMWRKYVKSYGLAGPPILEKRIHDYMEKGLSLEEAIRKIAKGEGYK